jgi:hypothetical protein
MRTFLAFLLLAVAGNALALGVEESADGDGAKYRDALSALISRADVIVVTEHSFELDLYDMDANKSLIPTDIVYGTRAMSPAQKSGFGSAIGKLDPKTQDAFPACIFEPHHTFRFYLKKKLISTLEVCFKCGQVEWDGINSRVAPPWSLYFGLAQAVKSVGFQPERDWTALAKKHVR